MVLVGEMKAKNKERREQVTKELETPRRSEYEDKLQKEIFISILGLIW